MDEQRREASALTRRGFIQVGARTTAGVGAVGSLGALLAACGSQGGAATGSATNAAARVSPGTAIPTAHVDFSMSPFADDTVPVIGMKLGYFKDNGVIIGPTQTGAKLNLTENIAPLLTGQVQAGSAVFEVLLSKLDNISNIRSFVIHGSFEGYALFAPTGSSVKTVGALVASGMPFNKAVSTALAQFKGKSLAFSNDPAAQLFYELVFATAGFKESQFNITRLNNSNIVSLALAGRTDLAAPSGGPQVMQLATAGLKPVLTEQQLLQASSDQRSLALVDHSAFVVTSDYYEKNYDTVLRMAAAIFRCGDLIRQHASAAAAAQLPFLNSYAGSSLTPKQLAFLHGPTSHERTFDEMGAFFEQSGPFNVYESGAAQLAALRKQGVLKRAHSVSEIEGAKKVWLDLKAFRAKCDALLKSHASSTAPAVATAKALYAQRNYLDAYRALATV